METLHPTLKQKVFDRKTFMYVDNCMLLAQSRKWQEKWHKIRKIVTNLGLNFILMTTYSAKEMTSRSTLCWSRSIFTLSSHTVNAK